MAEIERYEWLTVDEDGYGADMSGTTPAEMDRRMVIMQEIGAGRLVLAADHKGAMALLEEVRRRSSRPFGGHAPYDLAARIERFLDDGVYEPHPGADGGR